MKKTIDIALEESAIPLPTRHVELLALLAKRLTYDDCLRLTDGYGGHPESGDPDQAYDFIAALGALRRGLDEPL